MTTQRAITSISLPKQLKEMGTRLACEEERSFSNLIATLLEKHLAARNRLEPATGPATPLPSQSAPARQHRHPAREHPRMAPAA